MLVLGTLIGLWLGRANAARSLVFSSLLDAVTAIPPLAYLIIFVGIWGNSIPTMLVALTVSLILRMIKLVKTQTEIELDKAYVLCAVSSGASRSRVLFVHILPNIIRPLVHFLCLSCAEMIMNISAFSFIGLTLGDDVIDWGSMLSEGRSMLMTHPSLLFLPILFIFLCTLAFNLLAKQLEGGESRSAGSCGVYFDPRCLYWIDRCQRLRQNHPLKGADGGIRWGCIHQLWTNIAGWRRPAKKARKSAAGSLRDNFGIYSAKPDDCFQSPCASWDTDVRDISETASIRQKCCPQT